jgi:hypothetical protein
LNSKAGTEQKVQYVRILFQAVEDKFLESALPLKADLQESQEVKADTTGYLSNLVAVSIAPVTLISNVVASIFAPRNEVSC